MFDLAPTESKYFIAWMSLL